MSRALNLACLALFALVILLPLVWVFITSLKSGHEIFGSPWSLPTDPQWKNYAKAWSVAKIGSSFLNSLIVTLATLIILLPAGAMAAYVLARYVITCSTLIFWIVLVGMMCSHIL